MKKRIVPLLMAILLLAGIVLPAVSALCEGGEYRYKIYLTGEAEREMKNYKKLKKGDSSSAVREMKYRLVDLGYLVCCDGKVSKKFDQDTKDALLWFQTSNNLTGSDGVAYPYTLYKLYDEFAIPAWGRTYSTLEPGDEGWEVTNLQKRLTDTGYLADDCVSGAYDDATQLAVMKFQLENRMAPDGVAADWLQDILFSPNMNSAGKQAE